MGEEGELTEKEVGLNSVEGPLGVMYCEVGCPSTFTFHPRSRQGRLLLGH